jgi:hypothetical protein
MMVASLESPEGSFMGSGLKGKWKFTSVQKKRAEWPRQGEEQV